jgi:carbonic anhydrase
VDPARLGHEHVKHTVDMLRSYSVTLAEAIDEGRCAVVGVEYALAEGRVNLTTAVGEVGERPVAVV